MKTLLPLFLAAPLLAACSGADASGGASLGSGRTSAAIPGFRADTAFSYLETQVGFGPRVPGSSGHAAQLRWMTEFLGARADTVILQPFSHETAEGARLDMTNVFARFRPELRDRILVVAHWDTRPTADMESDPEGRARPIPGANDGGSGTAVLLELANVLSSHSPPVGVDLLFVDGEDYGPGEAEMYLGAKHFAATNPAYRPLYGLLLDMVGDQNPVFPIEGNSQESAPEVVERVWRMAEEIGHGSAFPRRDGGWITDDHVYLNRAGIRTIDIIDFDYAHWHRLSDDLPNVSPRGLGIVGSVVTALIYRGG